MVRDTSRLSRDPEVGAWIGARFKEHRIRLFDLHREHDLATASGKFTVDVLVAAHQLEIGLKKEAARASLWRVVNRGWPNGGKPPYGRVLVNSDRKEVAIWKPDDAVMEKVQEMYRLYIVEGLTMAAVGRRIGENEATIRRILVDHSGPLWVRHFTNPETGELKEVRTAIPPLLSDEQIEAVHQRAKQNQLERAGWDTRKRKYTLSHYIRCANPECGWSNLSGHVTRDSRKKDAPPVPYAYYQHNRHKVLSGCFRSIVADDIEDEIFSRLGQFLGNAKELRAAIHAALTTEPEALEQLNQEQADLAKKLERSKRKLSSAVEVAIEQKGTPAEKVARDKMEELNDEITCLQARQQEVADQLKVVDIPRNLDQQFARLLRRMAGLHGHASMHWPYEAKRELLRLFFGGAGSTRFDRAGKHKRSDERGIFITEKHLDDGTRYWTWEAKGLLGNVTGALTRIVDIYDKHMRETQVRDFSHTDLVALARLCHTGDAAADEGGGSEGGANSGCGFRVSSSAVIPAKWSSVSCTTTLLRSSSPTIIRRDCRSPRAPTRV